MGKYHPSGGGGTTAAGAAADALIAAAMASSKHERHFSLIGDTTSSMTVAPVLQ